MRKLSIAISSSGKIVQSLRVVGLMMLLYNKLALNFMTTYMIFTRGRVVLKLGRVMYLDMKKMEREIMKKMEPCGGVDM